MCCWCLRCWSQRAVRFIGASACSGVVAGDESTARDPTTHGARCPPKRLQHGGTPAPGGRAGMIATINCTGLLSNQDGQGGAAAANAWCSRQASLTAGAMELRLVPRGKFTPPGRRFAPYVYPSAHHSRLSYRALTKHKAARFRIGLSQRAGEQRAPKSIAAALSSSSGGVCLRTTASVCVRALHTPPPRPRFHRKLPLTARELLRAS